QRSGRDHSDGRGSVETPQNGISPGSRHAKTRPDVLWKTGRVARSESEPMAATIGASRTADRSFGSDVNGIGPGFFNSAGNLTRAWQRQPQAGIGWQGNGPHSFRRQELDFDAQTSRALRQRGKSTHDAIYLRVPGICRDENPHRIVPVLRPSAGYSNHCALVS